MTSALNEAALEAAINALKSMGSEEPYWIVVDENGDPCENYHGIASVAVQAYLSVFPADIALVEKLQAERWKLEDSDFVRGANDMNERCVEIVRQHNAEARGAARTKCQSGTEKITGAHKTEGVPRAMRKWTPIETAPDDGSPVWARGWDYGVIDGNRHYCWAYYRGGNWMESGCKNSQLQYLTDWMPLLLSMEASHE